MLKTPLDVVVLVRPIVLVIAVKRDFNPGLNLDCDHHNLCFNLMSTDAISIMQCTFLLVYIEYFICMFYTIFLFIYLYIYIPASKSIMIFFVSNNFVYIL